MKIVYVTNMSTLPANCRDCTMECRLPMQERRPDFFKAQYLKKRHPRCPLKVIETED